MGWTERPKCQWGRVTYHFSNCEICGGEKRKRSTHLHAYPNLTPCSPPPPPKPQLHEQIKITKADKKVIVAELLLVCHDCQKLGKNIPESVTPFNVAGTVREHIKTLANEEALCKCEEHIKSDFKQIFEPIPHIDELPTDIVAEIHLKNAEKNYKNSLICNSYPSPQKYKEAWKILSISMPVIFVPHLPLVLLLPS